MATGGFSVMTSTSTDVVQVMGRVSAAGAVVAPALNQKWTVTKTGTGTYTVVFTEAYAEFLGCGLDIEGSAGNLNGVYTWTAATKTLSVSTFAGSTPTNEPFAFCAIFSESRVP